MHWARGADLKLMVLRGAAVLCAATLTSGCVSMQPTMTSFSLDYNRVIADTRNRMILLNIVRSAYREPTYYTAVSQIEGSLNMQASISGQIANLAGGEATAFTPTISGTFTNAPLFTIVPLNSEEFAKGMLQPIDPDTIQLFLSQGWRERILAPLLVQKVECIYDDRVVAEIANEPGSFGGLVTPEEFAAIRFYTGKADANTEYKLTVPSAEALKEITGGALDKFDLKLDKVPADQTLAVISVSAQGSQHLEAQLPDQFRDECRARFKATLERQPKLTQRFKVDTVDVTHLAMREQVSAGGGGAASVRGQIALNVVFRSPDGIVYFLGERLRAKLESGTRPAAAGGDTLFDVDRNASGPVAVTVMHRGQHWTIPALEIEREAGATRAPVDRSLEVIALLNQLISVQTSLKEFSRAPSSVRVR